MSSTAEWVTIALLGKTRGNHGEITALPLSSKPERYEELRQVYLHGGACGEAELRELESTWFHGETLVFKFRGVDSISDAERLTGAEVRVPLSERAPLEADEFYQSDLLGCEVVDRRTGELLGHVTGWEDSGGAGTLVVEGDWLLPFARSICVEIDAAAKRIQVELPEGLKDVNRT